MSLFLRECYLYKDVFFDIKLTLPSDKCHIGYVTTFAAIVSWDLPLFYQYSFSQPYFQLYRCRLKKMS